MFYWLLVCPGTLVLCHHCWESACTSSVRAYGGDGAKASSRRLSLSSFREKLESRIYQQVARKYSPRQVWRRVLEVLDLIEFSVRIPAVEKRKLGEKPMLQWKRNSGGMSWCGMLLVRSHTFLRKEIPNSEKRDIIR